MDRPDGSTAPAPAPSSSPSPAARRVAAEHLNVAPWVQALPLAAPRRRFWALVIDLMLVAVVGSIVLPDRPSRPDRDADDESIAASVGAAASAASAAMAADAEDTPASAPVDGRPSGAAVAESVLASQSPRVLAHRVMKLERELAEARHPAAWYERGWRWLRGFITGYGSSMAYFTLVTAFWGGRTVGKRLMGLRVVEITGKPMTIALSFTRYGGYVAGLLTGGIGLAQPLWDRNRQGLQDKVAHTLVVDERAAR